MKKVLFLFLILLLYPVFVLAADKVEINTASPEQLDTLTGIGPAYAQKIIDGRPYSSVDDLIRVKGIGEKTLQKIKDQGLAYIEGQTQPIIQPVNITPSPALSTTPAPIAEQTEAVPTTYPDGIVLNEILPSPEGADETEEWIEIYNQNNFGVDLAGWRIKDGEGKSTAYVFPDETKIEPNGYLVLTRPQTKITLNNTGDKLTLAQPDGKIADSMTYGKSIQGQSYNRVNADWLWSSTLTPGSANITGGIKEETGEEPLVKNEQIVASLSQNTSHPRSFLFIFLIALGAAVSFLIIFFLFKNKI